MAWRTRPSIRSDRAELIGENLHHREGGFRNVRNVRGSLRRHDSVFGKVAP
jgi:hypothetical protein